MDEFESKIDSFFDGGPFAKVSTSKRGPPPPPEPPMPFDPDDIADKMSKGADRAIEPLREFGSDMDAQLSGEVEKAKRFAKLNAKAMFPITLATSPITGVIFAKNAKEHPKASTDDLIEMTNKEVLGWALDVANIAWPGTAAPDAKEQVKERVGGLVKTFAKEQLFE